MDPNETDPRETKEISREQRDEASSGKSGGEIIRGRDSVPQHRIRGRTAGMLRRTSRKIRRVELISTSPLAGLSKRDSAHVADYASKSAYHAFQH